jgi:sugar phosphate isomerase/epimerase
MYKNLSPDALGIIGRQGEMLEITLTHRFKGLDIDITDVAKRAKASSVEAACRYLVSAKVKIGSFALPVKWDADETRFKSDLAQLPAVLEVAKALGATRCHTPIRPTSDEHPFHENFQFHADRLRKLADMLAPAGLHLGLQLQSAPADRKDGGFEFIHQVDPLLLLVSTIGKRNVGVLLDTWTWAVGGGDGEKVRALRGDQIVSVLLADIPAGVDLATIQPQQRIIPVEGGQIDCASYLGVLEEIGYEGPISIAQHSSHMKGQTRESIVAKASHLLDSLLAGAGVAAATLAAAK